MNKTVKYALNGAIIFGIGNAIFNALKQHQKICENPDLGYNWSELLMVAGKGAVVGCVGGVVVGGVIDFQNASEEPLNTSAILGTVVAKRKLTKNDPIYSKLSRKADRLERWIKARFKNQLEEHILRNGSTEDNTALSGDFDIDLGIPFKPNSFLSTAAMYDALFQSLKNEYSDDSLVKVRVQGKSIGLICRIDEEDYKIDVVPYKLTAGNGNKTTGYLYVNSNSIFSNDGYTKTDIHRLKSIRLSPIQKNLLVLLKGWKQKYSVPISSHLLRFLILDAYDLKKGNVPRDFTKKILFVIGHIKDSIMYRRIVSVENTNNILTNIRESEKIEINKACENVIKDYAYQPNSILNYFN